MVQNEVPERASKEVSERLHKGSVVSDAEREIQRRGFGSVLNGGQGRARKHGGHTCEQAQLP